MERGRDGGGATLQRHAKGVPSSNGHVLFASHAYKVYLRAMHIRNVGMLLNTSACQIPTAFNIMVRFGTHDEDVHRVA
jgi:hypothetical protein